MRAGLSSQGPGSIALRKYGCLNPLMTRGQDVHELAELFAPEADFGGFPADSSDLVFCQLPEAASPEMCAELGETYAGAAKATRPFWLLASSQGRRGLGCYGKFDPGSGEFRAWENPAEEVR